MNKDLDMEVKNLNGVYNIINDGKKIQSSDNIIDIDYDGKGVTKGKVTIKDYKVIALGVEQDNKYIIYENGEIVYSGEKQSPVSFTEDSWETISLNVKVGNISKYKVGDKKEVSLTGFTNGEENSNGLYTVRIANTTTPEECKTKDFSQTACGFVVEFVDIIAEHNINPSGEYKGVQYDYGWNVDGYPASSMYTFVNNDIFNSLPEDLKDVIIDTKVISGHGKTAGETNFTSTDKLYILAPKEVFGEKGSNDTLEETRQLDYYKDVAKVTTSSLRAGKEYNGSATSWWLRSASSNDDDIFYGVNINGVCDAFFATSTRGVSVAFRIG